MARSDGVHKPSPVTTQSPGYGERRGGVLADSGLCFQRVSSICHALGGTWKVVLAAELGAKTLVPEECLPRAQGCDSAAETVLPGVRPVTGQARSTEGLRNLLQGAQLTDFPKSRFEPREPGFPASVLKFSTLPPW